MNSCRGPAAEKPDSRRGSDTDPGSIVAHSGWGITMLLRFRQGRGVAQAARCEPGLLLREPRLPVVAVVGPEATLDAPRGRGGRKEVLRALLLREAAGRFGLCGIDERLPG